jgi:hypothetical protein
MTVKTALKAYIEKSKADLYALEVKGYGNRGTFVALVKPETVLKNFEAFYISNNSDKEPCLRYKVTTADSASLRREALALIKVVLDDEAPNRGNDFEVKACEAFKGVLAPKNSAFYECGDFRANGKEIQAKANKATVCKLNQIA